MPEQSATPASTASATADSKQEQAKLKPIVGPIAAQIGLTPINFGKTETDYRARFYSKLGAEIGGIEVATSGLNEFGRKYAFGRNVLVAGPKDSVFDLVAATRYYGEGLSKIQPTDLSVGLRINLPKWKTIEYGFVDITKHTGVIGDDNKSLEVLALVGTKFGPINVDTTFKKSKGAPSFLEIEATTKPKSLTKDLSFAPYARFETFGVNRNNLNGNEPSVTVGAQVSFSKK